ncbi:hypothetical protein D9757_014470 [Collybiopsis confluens]|uniref:Uncharacterized protein n=1 Tax=Collybiopsis confluens TaxID=2823264 RepID=A0A8H5LMN0_9AGAR|nr:hypothetical protein D9757_014470 [Collybiopsis confluens]
MPADRYPKRTQRGPRSERAIRARSKKQGMKMADTHDIFLHQAPGRYLGMKSNRQLLLDRVHQDFPAGNTNLIRAPSCGRLHAFTMGLRVTNDLRITNVPVLDCFVDIILPEERSEIQRIVKSMFTAGVRFSGSSTQRDNCSSNRSVHLGRWEKFNLQPCITGETWALQKAQSCSTNERDLEGAIPYNMETSRAGSGSIVKLAQR